MPDQTPAVTIAENLEDPKQGVNNMGTFIQHSLPDQIKAAEYLANETAKSSDNLGILFRAFQFPGTI